MLNFLTNTFCLHILVFFLIYFHCAHCTPDTTDEGPMPLIVGGTQDDRKGHGKYAVSIQVNRHINVNSRFGFYHFCGGSIIGKNKILTAAHCLVNGYSKKKARDIVVVVGLRNRFIRTEHTRVMKVKKVIVCKQFIRKKNMSGDVGLLILKEDILVDNTHTGIIELADSTPNEKKVCTVFGWGRLFNNGPMSDDITFADVEIISFSTCKKNYGRFLIKKGMICAADPATWARDACSGDSGGPLICDQKLSGVVSWGHGCASKGYPGVYSDVAYWSDWIRNIAQTLYASKLSKLVFWVVSVKYIS